MMFILQCRCWNHLGAAYRVGQTGPVDRVPNIRSSTPHTRFQGE